MSDLICEIDRREIDGFTIMTNALVEYSSLEGEYPDDTPEQIKDIQDKLDRYELVYFCAQVKAFKNGINLGDSYLGCCLYDNYEQFIDENECWRDMVDEAINEAKQAIKGLCEAA